MPDRFRSRIVTPEEVERAATSTPTSRFTPQPDDMVGSRWTAARVPPVQRSRAENSFRAAAESTRRRMNPDGRGILVEAAPEIAAGVADASRGVVTGARRAMGQVVDKTPQAGVRAAQGLVEAGRNLSTAPQTVATSVQQSTPNQVGQTLRDVRTRAGEIVQGFNQNIVQPLLDVTGVNSVVDNTPQAGVRAAQGLVSRSAQVLPVNDDATLTAMQQSDAQAQENEDQKTAQPSKPFEVLNRMPAQFTEGQDMVQYVDADGRKVLTNIASGATPNAAFEVGRRRALDQQFGEGKQGVINPTTGAGYIENRDGSGFIANHAMWEQQQADKAADRVLNQREASANRFRRGENLPGERINAEGITYMPGSRMDPEGTYTQTVGGGGNVAGRAANQYMRAAGALGRQKGEIRRETAAAAAEQQRFDNQATLKRLDTGELHALANYANSQRDPNAGESTKVEIGMGEDLKGNSMPQSLTVGNTTITLDDTGLQQLTLLRDMVVSEGRATTANEAWNLAAELYAMGLGSLAAQE